VRLALLLFVLTLHAGLAKDARDTGSAQGGDQDSEGVDKGYFSSILDQGMDLLPNEWKQKLRQAKNSASEDPIGFATTVSDALSYFRRATGDRSAAEKGKKVIEDFFREEEETETNTDQTEEEENAARQRTGEPRKSSSSPPPPQSSSKATSPTTPPTTRKAGGGCCRVCKHGKPCGDTCISKDKTCYVGKGCACGVSTASKCCRTCKKGKPCGNSCISRKHQCHKTEGCACAAEGWFESDFKHDEL